MSDPTAPPSSVPLSRAADPAQAAAYRPLSLLALIGVAVAALYAAVVLIGGLVAFFVGDPWLMKGWTILIPITAAALSGMGLVQIQRSEGTLAGEKLARWGLLLSLLVGLGYWSYVGATYFAISREADKQGQLFLRKLADREVLKAFLMGLPPSERPAEGEGARGQVEARFNAGQVSRGGGGAYTAFAEAPYTRILGLGGGDTKVEFAGIDTWDYVGGGYQVRLLYQIETPQINFVMEVVAQGREAKGAGGRQWNIVMDKVGMRGKPDDVMTAKGKHHLLAGREGREFVTSHWLHAMELGKPLDVYLETLPAAERDGARRTAALGVAGCFLAAGTSAGAGPAGAAGAALAADPRLGPALVLPGMHDLLDGRLIRADKDVFWAPDGMRDEVIDVFHRAFNHPNGELALLITPDPKVAFPAMRVADGRFVVESDFLTRVPYTSPRFVTEGRVVVDCDAVEAEAGKVTSWRVLRVDLVGAKAAPSGTPPGQPGAPPNALPAM